MGNKSKIVRYIVAIIGEFAKCYKLTVREASNYLNRFGGLDFLIEHYEIEHLLSFENGVQDVAQICRNNGGSLL